MALSSSWRARAGKLRVGNPGCHPGLLPAQALPPVRGKEHGQTCPLLESVLIPGLGAPAGFSTSVIHLG